jgi:hypothetical protein
MSQLMPELPYAGTSGFSGTDTSRDRAITEDSNGTTGRRQKETLQFLAMRANYGATWKELAEQLSLHHGSASGVLSVLHLAGRVERLHLSRNRCKIYVLPEFVSGRATEKRKVKKCCPNCGHNF